MKKSETQWLSWLLAHRTLQSKPQKPDLRFLTFFFFATFCKWGVGWFNVMSQGHWGPQPSAKTPKTAGSSESL